MLFFLLWTLAMNVAAAPSSSLESIKDVPRRRFFAPVRATRVSSASSAACTNGVPASQQLGSVYPINDYTMVTPVVNETAYTIDKQWYDDNWVSGPHYMSFNHLSSPYGAFKCQYICNADGNCNSYFIWYEGVNTADEHLNCALFSGIIHPSVFVPINVTSGTMGGGGYDKLCL